ncbi:MAG: PDZ domain-containing protein, partial [Gammaproteobacteria bacterium]
IYSRSGGYMGLSFAIPIDLAMNVQSQLIEHGSVQRGRLGVSVQSVNQELADSFGLPRPTGALVNQVVEDTAADNAGLKSGDVITSVNGQPVEDAAVLSRVIADQKPGSKISLDVTRSGKQRQIEVKLGAAEDNEVAMIGDDGGGSGLKAGRLGAVVRALDENDKRALDETSGVLVERTEGAAMRAGLRPGDIILAVNSTAVKDPAQLQGLIAKAPEAIALLVKRDNAEIYIPVKLS